MTPSHTLTHSHAHACIPHNLTHPCLIPTSPKQSTAPSLHCFSLTRVVGDCGSDLAGAGQLHGSKFTAAAHGQFCCFLAWSTWSLVLFFFSTACNQIDTAASVHLAGGLYCVAATFLAVLSIRSAATATTSHCCRKSLIFTMIGWPKLLKT